ncbi:MAG: hypothetical protein LDL12_01170 [Anaerolinea sp.]|nr:hypothetical protein [Anaerolinea sp.]
MNERFFAILCLGLIILIPNIILFSLLLRRKPLRLPFFHTANWNRIARTAQHPWNQEDAQLEELSQRVQQIQSPPHDPLTPPK